MKFEGLIRGNINDLEWKLIPRSDRNRKRNFVTWYAGKLVPKFEVMTTKIWIDRCLERFFNREVHA